MGFDAFPVETFNGVVRQELMALAVADEFLVQSEDESDFTRHNFNVV